MKLINEYGLKGKVRSNKAGCLDACEIGPAVVIYPSGFWYTGVNPEDVTEIFEKSILGDQPVERLLSTQETWNRLAKVREKKK